MNKLKQTPFKKLTMLLCFIAIGAYGQKQTKTFNETFNVSKEAVLDINTSHADIEFETWSKDEVAIEAIIEIEDATDEEAEAYFKNSGFKILGNSKEVSIATDNKNAGLWPSISGDYQTVLSDLQNLRIEMPQFPETPHFESIFNFEEFSNMPVPPVPPMPKFDHKAFKADGEKYLKEWQKKFEESYDDAHIQKLEEWAERMEKRQVKMAEKREKRAEKREEMMEKRAEMLEKRIEKRTELREKLTEARIKRMEDRNERNHKRRALSFSSGDSNSIIVINGDTISTHSNGGPNIFYSSSNGSHKNYKVKKTIKIKMPKGMKIKMDVRHGEVKLAENTKNLNATLSHSSLWATTIDGDKTTISASYSPVNVQNWNYGQLHAKYSDKVALKEVLNLRLNAISSDVIIERLENTAFIKNDFGPIQINSVSNDFKDLDITLQNAELNCDMPKVPFTIYVNGTSSKLSTPASITFTRTKNHDNTIHKGYYKKQNSGKSITVNSKYSEVVVE